MHKQYVKDILLKLGAQPQQAEAFHMTQEADTALPVFPSQQPAVQTTREASTT